MWGFREIGAKKAHYHDWEHETQEVPQRLNAKALKTSQLLQERNKGDQKKKVKMWEGLTPGIVLV